MVMELMTGYRDNNFMEDNAVCEAASRLESVEKLINLLSQTQQQFQTTSNSTSNSKSSMENIDTDYKVAADVAISMFKVISLLGHTRTGHTCFKRAPIAPPSTPTEPRDLDHGVVDAVLEVKEEVVVVLLTSPLSEVMTETLVVEPESSGLRF
ncbi:probable WRKY transcription factor 15 [Glycine soja]|uniref:probable WRKY transcription factor 15 n=1 Tax=Glycine soja TaxID=3848 RepID=UPI00103B64BE|nr:probable WRKY transcription factor 15 [Glycine soja]